MAVDLSEIVHIERITVGRADPQKIPSEDEIQKQIDRLNEMLNGFPKGYIIGIEKNFAFFDIGGNQVALQWTVYHVGFTRRPLDKRLH